MQPYQEASEEVNRQKNQPAQDIGSAISLGGSALAGGALLGRVAPFLSRFIPTSLAVQGLSKIDPRLGNFINGAIQNGHTANDALDFIKSKVMPEQEQQQQAQEPQQPQAPEQQSAPDQRNILEQYSPELYQRIKAHVQSGMAPEKAAMMVSKAYSAKQFLPIIKKMEEDHKTPFASIVQSIFGGGQMAQKPQQQAQDQGQQQPQGQQMGPGAQALMQVLQGLQKTRGAK